MRGSINTKLTGDYLIAYQDIGSYIQSSNIPLNSKFSIEVNEDMKDMLLSAQKDKVPISDIIGKDIKSFCEAIVASHNTKKVKLLGILKQLKFYLCFFVIITIIFQLFNGSINLTIIITFFLTWFLYRYILNYFYKKLCLKFKGLKNKIICLLLIYALSMLALLPIELLIITYCNLSINGFISAAISLLLILFVHVLIKWYSCF